MYLFLKHFTHYYTVVPAQEFELQFTEDMRLLSDDVSLILGIGIVYSL
jgi:hypothetical protein